MRLGVLSGFEGYNEHLHREEQSQGEGHCRNNISTTLLASDFSLMKVSFGLSAWHKLASSGKREPQFRKCLHQIGL